MLTPGQRVSRGLGWMVWQVRGRGVLGCLWHVVAFTLGAMVGALFTWTVLAD